MDLSALSGVGSKGTSSSDRTSLIKNYETFLTLLTTQLKNQNPLEPMDANQFTEQLVQYSSVEQQVKTNSQLEGLVASMSAANVASLVSYVGKTVEAEGTTTQLANGSAKWRLESDRDVEGAQINIRNSAGRIVATKTVDLKKGSNDFTWDGKNDAKVSQADGDYQISATGKDEAGARASITSKITGKVTKVDFSGAAPVLLIGDITVPLSAIKSIKSTT